MNVLFLLRPPVQPEHWHLLQLQTQASAYDACLADDSYLHQQFKALITCTCKFLQGSVATLVRRSWTILSYFVANLSKTVHISFYQNWSGIVDVTTKNSGVFLCPTLYNIKQSRTLQGHIFCQSVTYRGTKKVQGLLFCHYKNTCIMMPRFHWYSLRPPKEGWPG